MKHKYLTLNKNNKNHLNNHYNLKVYNFFVYFVYYNELFAGKTKISCNLKSYIVASRPTFKQM